MPHPLEKRRKPARGRVILAAVALVLAALVADYCLYPGVAQVGGRSSNRGENGLWLRYSWYTHQPSAAELTDLAHRLAREQIRYAYFHVLGVSRDGSLRYHYPEAAGRLVAALHAQAPGVQALAWVYAGNAGAGGPVDLADPRVRRQMVAEARWLTTVAGFDGVQWDYEICPSGDETFLALLRETRAALPPGKLLSVAAPMWLPRFARRWTGSWNEDYFAQVAQDCDQIAVMCYDSGLYLPRAYVGLVREQARRVPVAVGRGNPACQVLLGLPTYEAGGRSHNPRAENLRLALKGVREGADEAGAAPAGVALFADYTTNAAEWATYDRWWLGR